MSPSGPPVVLLHGLCNSAVTTWVDTGWTALLADAGREVLALDLPGHGSAPKPHDPAAYADMEGDLLASLPPGPLDAVGYSLGARVLLGMAAREPERFGRIVVAGVGSNLFRDERSDVLASAIESGGGDNPVLARFARMAREHGNDPAALAAVMRRPARALTADDLARITCPVLVVLGDRDFTWPPDPLVDALPRASLRVLRGVDHFATPKDFGFLDAALEFLGAAP